jgi:SAM-dependent methyltransferase
VAIAAQRPLYAIVTKEGRMGLAATMNASALVLNVVLNLLLLPSHGIVGAAVASTVTYLALGIGYVLATRSDGVSGWRDLVPRMDDLARLGHAVRGIGALHPSRSPVGKDAHPPARSPALEDPPPPAPVRGCPLCGATDSRPVLSVPYATIWRQLRAQWGAIFPPDVMARHAPGSDACLVRCDDCGLEYFEGAVPGDGEFYERLMAGIPYHGGRWEFEIVLARLGSDAAVVDLGCGDGAFVRLAARNARRAVGVDHNADAIASLIRSGSEGSALSFEAFAEANPSAFDVATSFHTLEHLSDVGTVMRAARQLLRARGCLFVSVPNRARSGRGDEEPLDCPPHHISRWNEDQFEELAGRFDLRLLALHLEEPDLSHARAAALSRHRGFPQHRSGEPGILERLALRAAVSRRRHSRAIANGDYRRRGIVGHSMLAEFDVPSE